MPAQVGVLYKASQAKGGGFKYSTASAICMAEFVKLAMSIGFHLFAPRLSSPAPLWEHHLQGKYHEDHDISSIEYLI